MSYLTNDYRVDTLNKALAKFLDNSIKISEREQLGKKCQELYVQNRLILAVVKFYSTAFPCDDLDKPINCLNHIGLNRDIKKFDYFNSAAIRLLEGVGNRLLEQGGNRLLEGIVLNANQDYVCTCDDAGVYYQTSTGSYLPISTTPLNTDNYESL